jgi:hypothetical protein
MKKLISIFLLFLIVSCVKDDIYIETPIVELEQSIFEKGSTVLTDTDLISFELEAEGEYYLIIKDEMTNDLMTREVFSGVKGKNTLQIFTKAMPKGSYHLILTDIKENQLQKTNIKL